MKILLLSLFSLLGSLLYSQGNLQFNQVKLIGDAPSTVPDEKVWKVENFMHTGEAPFALPEVNFPMIDNGGKRGFYGLASYTVNGQSVRILAAIAHQTTLGISSPTAISWFPAGSTLAAGTNMLYLSVIEFNIVP
jgi:hypothetical protein